MAPDVVRRKLEALEDSVRRIDERCPASLSDLMADRDAQDVLVLNLTRAVQCYVDVGSHLLAESEGQSPQRMADVFNRMSEKDMLPDELSARLHQALGFRNLAVHRYDDIDWSLVHGIRLTRLADFREFARAIRDRAF